MSCELVTACDLDWSQAGPAIFDSMLQGIIDKKAHRNLGVHYTSSQYQAIGSSLFADSGSRQFPASGNNAAGQTDWFLVLKTSPVQ